MPVVRVTNMDTTKTGKRRIYFDGKNNWADAVYIGQRCVGIPAVGDVIEAETTSKTWPDGKVTWFLNSFKTAPAANGAAQQPAQTAAALQAAATYDPKQPFAVAKQAAGWDIPTGDLSRFASNIVGQAITAGLIKEPRQVAQWIQAAYMAAEALRSGKVDELVYENEPIPDLGGGADPAEQQGFQEEGDPGFDPNDASVPF
jgi:hypothetical protein